MNEIKYYLVLEKQPGNYGYIDLSKLDIFNTDNSNDIGIIDTLTSNYSEEEIINSVRRSNILDSSFPDEGHLKVVSNMKHSLSVMSKEVFLEIKDFIDLGLEFSQSLRDRMQAAFIKLINKDFEDISYTSQKISEFGEALKQNNLNDVFKIIRLLPYPSARNIYFIIYEELERKREQNIRLREKLSEAA